MNNSALAHMAALPSKTTPELKQLWRDLYDREPPPYNKPFLVKRLAITQQFNTTSTMGRLTVRVTGESPAPG